MYGAFAYTLFRELDRVLEFIMKQNVCANAKLKDLGGGFVFFTPQHKLLGGDRRWYFWW
jgi:hypothetical protein